MFVIKCSNIGPNLIMVLPGFQKKQPKVLTLINFFYDVTDFEICRFARTQKSSYLENERLIFLQIKIIRYKVCTKWCGGL